MGLDLYTSRTRNHYRYGSYGGVHWRRQRIALAWALAARRAGAPDHVANRTLGWLKHVQDPQPCDWKPELLESLGQDVNTGYFNGLDMDYQAMPTHNDWLLQEPWPLSDMDDDYNRLPFPEDMIPFEGAFTGIFKLLNMSDCNGYHSPGDVRDIAAAFQLIIAKLGNDYPVLKDGYQGLGEYFIQAALNNEGIIYA